jgi:hypothetical protein
MRDAVVMTATRAGIGKKEGAENIRLRDEKKM